jgi:lysophospholipase L1-like esterase
VKAVDEAGNEGSEASCAFTCEAVPPIISGVSASGTTISSAVITWTTGESATSQVEYGTTSGYGSSSPLDTSLVTTHNINLTGLTDNTTYHYRVRSKDAAGKEASSNDNTFSTVPSAYAVYCVGDSLTAGMTADGSYEPKLRELLGSSVAVVNKGGGGAHTSDMLSLLNSDVLPNHPAFVIIWGGINDILNPECSLDATKANLQSMYTQAHNQGIQVIAVNISPCKAWSEWTESAQAAIDDVNAWIATTAMDVDYKIDVYSLLEDPANPDYLLWPDYAYGGGGLHLSEAGYSRVAQAIYDGTAAFHG